MTNEVYELSVSYIKAYYKFKKLAESLYEESISIKISDRTLPVIRTNTNNSDNKAIRYIDVLEIVNSSFSAITDIKDELRDIYVDSIVKNRYMKDIDISRDDFDKRKVDFIKQVAINLTSKELSELENIYFY